MASGAYHGFRGLRIILPYLPLEVSDLFVGFRDVEHDLFALGIAHLFGFGLGFLRAGAPIFGFLGHAGQRMAQPRLRPYGT
jgi:hypothetical protein